jgi:hypothetical protein
MISYFVAAHNFFTYVLLDGKVWLVRTWTICAMEVDDCG